MRSTDLPAAVLARKAVVYVRQSSSMQVLNNQESQRRQYELVEVARDQGFRDIEVIDDDLGRTASGAADRPGFDRLVAMMYENKVGAVLCLDATRLARNGRDWEHLLEVCGFVGARIIDLKQGPTIRPCPTTDSCWDFRAHSRRLSSANCTIACPKPPRPRRGAASCALRCRQASYGIAKRASISTPTNCSSRRSGRSLRAFANWAAPARCCCR